MSDPLDPADPAGPVDAEVRPPVPLDWRDRLAAAADAAGLRVPAARVLAALAALAAVVAVVAVAVAARSGSRTDVAATLPRTSATTAAPTSTTAAEVIVHVAGSVAAPGVHLLDGGDRVVDAVDAAGGAGPEADLSRLNLAAPVQDGERIYVPAVGEEVPEAPPRASGPAADDAAAPVDVNAAGEAELETLPGVGPAIAAAIVGHRDESGPFRTVEDLLEVPGIGEARLAALRDLVTV